MILERQYHVNEKYSAEDFEVQLEIPDPRRKIKLDLPSSVLVSTMTPERA